LPISRNGILADVLIPPAMMGGGKLQNKIFLLSGGFYMTGITNDSIWANGMLDLVGSDTLLNSGYTYHKFADNTQKWGLTSPCYLIFSIK